MARGEQDPLIQVEGTEEGMHPEACAPIQGAGLNLTVEYLPTVLEGREHSLRAGQAALRSHPFRGLGLVASIRKGPDQEGVHDFDLRSPQRFPRTSQSLGDDLIHHRLF
jgi:hypothetical protein